MAFRKGDRVRHPSLSEWGVGEVLDDSNGKTVRVFFVGAGDKTLMLDHVAPVKVSGAEGQHPVLDNLHQKVTSGVTRYYSLPQAIESFLGRFPDGFYGERFAHEERNYKVSAHELAREHLAAETLGSSVKKGDFSEVCKRALKVANSTNLIFPNEKMALKDGLASAANQALFATNLVELLWGSAEYQDRFKSFCEALEECEAAKWTNATYYPFLVHPGQHMFVKPTVTQLAAELCGFEINYRPELNWKTYNQVLKLSQYLFDALSELKPRDMIDVQSFMWCVARKY